MDDDETILFNTCTDLVGLRKAAVEGGWGAFLLQ
jgi:hypothetical protein